jgi:hypothetical protein
MNRLAILGNHLPRQCGIATVATPHRCAADLLNERKPT